MHRLRLVLLGSLIALLAACGGSVQPSGTTASPGASAGATAAVAVTDEPAASDGAGATDDPAATGDPVATDEPTPTEEPLDSQEPAASDLHSPDAGGGGSACSGSAANREWFEGFARVVDWPVLCAVLPKGWFVSKGSYRLASGGMLIVSYKGPGGASIVLSEGAYCVADAAAGCTPPGSDAGDAALGPLDGTFYESADGFAVVVAPGENPGWLMTTKGLTRETSVSLAAAVAQVGG